MATAVAGSDKYSGRLALAIVLLAGALRLYHLGALSLWVDEGLTVTFARLPWPTLLGLHGTYDPHPPLFYAVVKLASLAAPELIAGRLVSAIAGTLTVGALYLLGARLAGRRMGLLAAAALALSPLHIWYSQEARQYALNVLLVAVSYLALVILYQDGPKDRRGWVVVYGLSILCALYCEYSALFALAPQVCLLVLLVRRHGQAGLWCAGAAAVAGLAFLPWLPHLAVVATPTSSQSQFAVSADKVGGTVLSLIGLAANNAVFDGSALPPWNLWPGAAGLLLIGAVPAALAGAIALARRPLALLVAASLLVGTIVVAVVVSLLYPSYTERTILYAVLGWAILVAAAARGTALPRAARVVGRVSVAFLLVMSLLTLVAIDTDAYKQQWNSLAADTVAAARFGWPIVTYPTVAATLIDLYQPRALAGRHIAIGDGGDLPALGGPTHARPSALWYAYIDASGAGRIRAQLAAAGYELLQHTYYPYPLYLDLYAQPGARLGHEMPLNGRFAGQGAQAAGWLLSQRGVSFEPDGFAGRRLTLVNTPAGQSTAAAIVPAAAGRLYTLTLQARARSHTGGVQAFLVCMTAAQAFLAVEPNAAGASVAPDGAWHTARIAGLCSTGTGLVRVDLRDAGSGPVDYRAVSLQETKPG